MLHCVVTCKLARNWLYDYINVLRKQFTKINSCAAHLNHWQCHRSAKIFRPLGKQISIVLFILYQFAGMEHKISLCFRFTPSDVVVQTFGYSGSL